jgi:hypothetical protein
VYIDDVEEIPQLTANLMWQAKLANQFADWCFDMTQKLNEHAGVLIYCKQGCGQESNNSIPVRWGGYEGHYKMSGAWYWGEARR